MSQPELLQHALSSAFGAVENITVRVKHTGALVQHAKSWALAEFAAAGGAAAASDAGTVEVAGPDGQPVALELRPQEVEAELLKEDTGKLHSTWVNQKRRHGASFQSLCGPSQRAMRAQGSFKWVPTVKKNDAIPYMEALEAWRDDDERADFWARATQEYYWRESGEMSKHRPAFSGAQDATVAASRMSGSGNRSGSRSGSRPGSRSGPAVDLLNSSSRAGSRPGSRSIFVEPGAGKNLRPLSSSSMGSLGSRPNTSEGPSRKFTSKLPLLVVSTSRSFLTDCFSS